MIAFLHQGPIMSVTIDDYEIEVSVKKLLKLAYSKNNGLTSEIMLEAGAAQLTVDQNGVATLTGNGKILTFSGKQALEEIGVDVKRVHISFRNQGKHIIGYTATVRIGVVSLSVHGSIDLEKLITSCSGLLCQTARGMLDRKARLRKATNF